MLVRKQHLWQEQSSQQSESHEDDSIFCNDVFFSKCQLLIIGEIENLDKLIEVYNDKANSPQISLDFPLEIGVNKAIDISQ